MVEANSRIAAACCCGGSWPHIPPAYVMSQGTSRSPLDLPAVVNALAITKLVFMTNRRKRGFVEAVPTFGHHTPFPRISKVPAKTLAWSSNRPPCRSRNLKCYSISVLEKSPSKFLWVPHAFIRLDEKGEYSQDKRIMTNSCQITMNHIILVQVVQSPSDAQ